MVVGGEEVLTVGSSWAKGLEWNGDFFLGAKKPSVQKKKKGPKPPLNTVQKKKKPKPLNTVQKKWWRELYSLSMTLGGNPVDSIIVTSVSGNGMGDKMQLEYSYCA